MSYIPIDEDPDGAIIDILKRKEIYSLRDDGSDFRKKPDEYLGKYFKLYAHQIFSRNFFNPNTEFPRYMLKHGTGLGKCHGRGTLIMMADGRLSRVENINVGDYLMGECGVPRRVLSLASGRDVMYKITPMTGIAEDAFICNSEHVLTLNDGRRRFDVPLNDYLKKAETYYADCGLYTSMVSYSSSRNIDNAYKIGQHYGYAGGALTLDQRYSTFTSRLNILAGFLNTAATESCGDFIVDTKMMSRRKILEIISLARSVGCLVFMEDENINISGICVDLISCKPRFHVHVSTDPRIPFEVKPISLDEYYGFTLEGNGRYLLGSHIVTHNTIASIAISQKFVELYKEIYKTAVANSIGRFARLEAAAKTPTVFILGFEGTKTAFINDLLRFPEFGIASYEEIAELKRLKELSLQTGGDSYAKYFASLKRRITDKSRGGFYEFFGYEEIVNRLFLSDSIKPNDIEKQATARRVPVEELFAEYIKQKKIEVNVKFLRMFDNSLLICDEVHDNYNSQMKNNRGVALQFILDNAKDTRAVLLSATPINNNPAEAVDIAALLLPKTNPLRRKLVRSELFTDRGAPKSDETYDILARAFKGRISFLQDNDVRYFPRKHFAGERIQLREVDAREFGFDYLPYLNFVPAAMSQLQLDTIEAAAHQDGEVADDDDNETSVSSSSYSLYDIVFPSPASEKVGLYNSNDILRTISTAPQSWRDRKGIVIKEDKGVTIVGGRYLARENIEQYSAKYAKFIDIIDAIMRRGSEKVLIYHNRIRTSGVALIAEILREMGVLDQSSVANDNTRCAICGRRRAEHQDSQSANHMESQSTHHNHSTNDITEHFTDGDNKTSQVDRMEATLPEIRAERREAQLSERSAVVHCTTFVASRYLLIHTEVGAAVARELMLKYNGEDNVYGHKYQFLIGSKFIKQSYNFVAVRHLVVLSLPTNIPTAIQVFGRAIRRGSHNLLPEDKRDVTIHIPVNIDGRGNLSIEARRWAEKLRSYLIIQRIEYEMNRYAVDGDITRDIIMPESMRVEYFDNGSTTPRAIFGNLYFDNYYKIPELNGAPDDTTFRAYGVHKDEINNIIAIIKRLFIREPSWTYAELVAAVKNPGFANEVNPALFSDGNIAIALTLLLSADVINNAMSARRPTEAEVIYSIFNPDDRLIYIDGVQYVIVQRGELYLRAPLITHSQSVIESQINQSSGQKNKVLSIMRRYASRSKGKPYIDIDSYVHAEDAKSSVSISYDDYITASGADFSFDSEVREFIKVFGAYDEEINAESIIVLLTTFTYALLRRLTETGIMYYNGTQSAVHKRLVDLSSLKVAENIYNIVLQMLYKFAALVLYKEVAKYSEVLKQLHYNKVPDGDTPIGFINGNVVTIYDSRGWSSVTRAALNLHEDRKENDKLIGILEDINGVPKMKIRAPSRLEKGQKIDMRLVSRGIVCGTKTKTQLLPIAQLLGIDKKSKSVNSICDEISAWLIKSELEARKRMQKTKYLYWGFG